MREVGWMERLELVVEEVTAVTEGGRGGGGVLVQTEESEADRESDSSLKDVRCDATDERGEVPPPFACLPRAAEVGVFGPPEAEPPPVEDSRSLSSSITL